MFGSLPGISQLPLDLGFSRFIVRDPPAAIRFVSFAGIAQCCRYIQGVVVFVAPNLPDDILFWGWIVLLFSVCLSLLDLKFLLCISAVARFMG